MMTKKCKLGVRERESFRVYKVKTGECGTFFHIFFLNDKSGGRGDRLSLLLFPIRPLTFCHYHSYPELAQTYLLVFFLIYD